MARRGRLSSCYPAAIVLPFRLGKDKVAGLYP